MKITVKALAAIIDALQASLVAHGIEDAAGDFIPGIKVDVYASVLQDVEVALQAQGVVVPVDVDKVIKLLPGILTVFGA